LSQIVKPFEASGPPLKLTNRSIIHLARICIWWFTKI